jgi:hypothetical protein
LFERLYTVIERKKKNTNCQLYVFDGGEGGGMGIEQNIKSKQEITATSPPPMNNIIDHKPSTHCGIVTTILILVDQGLIFSHMNPWSWTHTCGDIKNLD